MTFLMSYKALRLINLKNKKVTSAKFLEVAMYVEVIIYLLLYDFRDSTFKENDFCGFQGFLAIPRKLIHLNSFFRSVI